MDENRKDAPQPAAGVSQDASATISGGAGGGGISFYRQAVAMCNRSLAAGALQEALLWAQQAEEIGAVLEERNELPEVVQAYANVALLGCLRAQELALTSGNILREHETLNELISTATDRLSTHLPQASRPTALLAQGYAKEVSVRLDGILNHDQTWRYTKPTELDSLLESLARIEECVQSIASSASDNSTFRERKLILASTAVSNARFSLARCFTSILSDWGKAEVYCRRAYLLLTTKKLEEGSPDPSGDPDLDRALSAFPAACAALARRSYKESTAHLDTVTDGLKKARK